MDCCNGGAKPSVPSADHRTPLRPNNGSRFTRRSLLQGFGVLAGVSLLGGCGFGGRDQVRIAFCSQLLCVVPYEVTASAGHFADQDLDVELVYSQGGGAAMQALSAGAVEYAATSFDAFAQARAEGSGVRRFASTGRLPLFALATAPEMADDIVDLADLEGRTVGVAALGNADHSILLYLLNQAGLDPDSVTFATIGTNAYDVLRIGDVDAGMVQEPALSLLEDEGARVLFNAMDIDDAEEQFGGPYEFMGVAVREDEIEERREEMQRVGDALAAGLETTRSLPGAELIDALPSELVAGEDTGLLADVLDRYRTSLYPEGVGIDPPAVERALEALRASGAIEADLQLDDILDLDVLDVAGVR